MKSTVAVVGVLVGCSVPAIAPIAPAATAPAAPSAIAAEAPDPPLFGVVRSARLHPHRERFEVHVKAMRRDDMVGIVKVTRSDGEAFAARTSVARIDADSEPWKYVLDLSRFDVDTPLPTLLVDEVVELTPIVRIPWLDDEPRRVIPSDVAPRSR